MRYYHDGSGLVIKSWCEHPEDGAIEQAKHLSQLPFAFRQICLMPDVHWGYGMPIGGVLATKGYVIPNAVGVDVSCGVQAMRTSLRGITRDELKKVMGTIRETVPVGFNHHTDKQEIVNCEPRGYVTTREWQSAHYQVGSLGGGNHFCEIQQDTDGVIWVMIHSGSRNFGLKVAKHYNDLAKALNATWHVEIDPSWDLAFLPLDSPEGQAYMVEMETCQEFARANRTAMMDRALAAFNIHTLTKEDARVDVNHNYARMEHHFGENVLVHRKGAISARDGEIGIIPGSQGTASYIVKGKGNPESFTSSSHGAGRQMGRKEAQRSLNLEEEQRRLDERGILHAIRGVKDLDEAAGAYKPIETVMLEQQDLVEIVTELRPLGVIKA